MPRRRRRFPGILGTIPNFPTSNYAGRLEPGKRARIVSPAVTRSPIRTAGARFPGRTRSTRDPNRIMPTRSPASRVWPGRTRHTIRRATRPATRTSLVRPSGPSRRISARSFCSDAESRNAATNLPGTCWTDTTRPATGLRHTCTSKMFRNTEMPPGPERTILPSAGERTRASSRGATRSGSRKNQTVKAAAGPTTASSGGAQIAAATPASARTMRNGAASRSMLTTVTPGSRAQLQRHEDRILPRVLVVPLAPSDRAEPEALVEGPRRGVRGTHLERRLDAPFPPRPRQDSLEEHAAESATSRPGMHGDVVDLELAVHGPEAGVGQDAAPLPQHDVPRERVLLDLEEEAVPRPRRGERRPLDGEDLVQIESGHLVDLDPGASHRLTSRAPRRRAAGRGETSPRRPRPRGASGTPRSGRPLPRLRWEGVSGVPGTPPSRVGRRKPPLPTRRGSHPSPRTQWRAPADRPRAEPTRAAGSQEDRTRRRRPRHAARREAARVPSRRGRGARPWPRGCRSRTRAAPRRARARRRSRARSGAP